MKREKMRISMWKTIIASGLMIAGFSIATAQTHQHAISAPGMASITPFWLAIIEEVFIWHSLTASITNAM
ncbi:MAG: hypothetical protein IPJ07_05830 [Acidobacteria bacterium]|nr:hypothetical protein [Acidobacteriota bacterium]